MMKIVWTMAVVALIGTSGVPTAFAEKPGSPGTATLFSSVTNPDGTVTPFAITPDAVGAYLGSFNKDGAFSFNLVGTNRKVCFNFSQPIGLLDPPRIAGATPPASDCYAASFLTLGSSTASGITSIKLGTTEIRSVRFNWANPNVTGSNDPENYSLGFRGDAILDGRTEMSRVRVTCDLADATSACRRWILEPCATVFDVPCQAQDVPVQSDGSTPVGAPVGQAGGGFPKGGGNTTIERYVMPWRMVIAR